MSVLASAPPAIHARATSISNRALVVAISVVLFLPSAIFATGLQPFPAILVLAGCCCALALIAVRWPDAESGVLSDEVDFQRLSFSIALAAALLLVGGETHVFFPTWDWTLRDAVLADLVGHGFPVGYRIGDADYLIRAPLGMYMAPALVGHVLGLHAAHVALLIQNATFLGVIFYLLAILGAGWPQVAILVLFSGLSIIGAAARALMIPQTGTPFWLQWGLDSWHPMFQYSGTLVQFFWVPNHALPGWWLATLLLLQVRRQVDVAVVGSSVAGALLWSPLCVVPVAPWLLWCALREPRLLSAKRTIVGAVAAAGFLPVLVYLVLAASSIGGGSLFGKPDFLVWYLIFVALALAPLGYLILMRAAITSSDRALVVFSSLVLLVLPLFRFGPNNDLVMRGSIVALTIVAFAFGDVLLRLTKQRDRAAVAGWFLAAIGAASACVEIGRAVATPAYAVSNCSVMEATLALGESGLPTNYIVRADLIPAWLLDTAKVPILQSGQRNCWPDRSPPQFFGLQTLRMIAPVGSFNQTKAGGSDE